jgi:hypothetical protein
MKISIDSASEFRDQFIAYNRDNFSRQGYELLFDHFEEIDPDMVMDVIAICCDYNESDAQTIATDYNIVEANGMDEDDARQVVREYLDHHTTVVGETSTGFVYACF